MKKKKKRRDKVGLTWKEFTEGGHCQFDVRVPTPIPEIILSLNDEETKKRAIAAWDSGNTVSAHWSHWNRFIQCGANKYIPNQKTQDTISTHYPHLTKMNTILQIVSPTAVLRGAKKKERDSSDRMIGASRGRTETIPRALVKNFGSEVRKLTDAFRKEIKVNIQALCLLDIKLPAFHRNYSELIRDAIGPMAITVDEDAGKNAVNFQVETSKLISPEYRRITSSVSSLLELLKTRPSVVFYSLAHLEIKRVLETAVATTANDSEGETTKERAEKVAYLGIRIKGSNGGVTRDGFDDELYLGPIHLRLLQILANAKGNVVDYNVMRVAWGESEITTQQNQINTEICRMNKEISKLDLIASNQPKKGYKLVCKTTSF